PSIHAHGKQDRNREHGLTGRRGRAENACQKYRTILSKPRRTPPRLWVALFSRCFFSRAARETTWKRSASEHFRACVVPTTTPQRARTSNLRFRRPMLYPIELGVQSR